MLRKPETLIQKANRLVPIVLVLEWVGINVPEFASKSYKARCPYADMYHLDADSSRSMRVYSDTNTANCFMGCGLLTPVSVFAKMHDLAFKSAAQEILDRVGYKPKTFTQRWEEAVNHEPEINREAYRDALMEHCYSLAPKDWNILQYDSEVSGMLGKLLVVLDKADSEKNAKMWLDAAKPAMATAIRKEHTNG